MSDLPTIGREISVTQSQVKRGSDSVLGTTRSASFKLWLEGVVSVPPEQFRWPVNLDCNGVEKVVEVWRWSLANRLKFAIAGRMPAKIEAVQTADGWKTTVEWRGGDQISVAVRLDGFQSLDDADSIAREIVMEHADKFRPEHDAPVRAAIKGLVPREGAPTWAYELCQNPMV